VLPLEANSVGEKEQKEGVKREQRTGKVTKDGDEASVQIMAMRGVPWQRYLLKQRDDVDDCFAEQKFMVQAIIRRALMTRGVGSVGFSWRLWTNESLPSIIEARHGSGYQGPGRSTRAP
jgi:hypothetical protein